MKINPKQMDKLMKQMGMQAVEIAAQEVVIYTADKEIVIKDPHVTRVNMMGSDTFQITGRIEEREEDDDDAGDDDVQIVIEKTGASEKEVREALQAVHGDLAEAIMMLKRQK